MGLYFQFTLVILITSGSALPFRSENADRLKRSTPECIAPGEHKSDIIKGKSFPSDDYKQFLETTEGKKWKPYLQQQKHALTEIFNEKEDKKKYPDCLFEPLCESERKLVQGLKVKERGSHCWIAEFVIWTECWPSDTAALTCAKKNTAKGYDVKCVPDVRMQTLLVYCERKSNPPEQEIKLKSIRIQHKCKAKLYKCKVE